MAQESLEDGIFTEKTDVVGCISNIWPIVCQEFAIIAYVMNLHTNNPSVVYSWV